ncbi:MAG: DUF1425 domain-containing protein [Methyloprofundus sp.]|nr:DUF1425 domain-containing protein [Methyloprofundus sp.]
MHKRLLILSGCLSLFACQSTVNTVANTEPQMQAQALASSKVFTDPFLKSRLSIDRVDQVTLPDGLLKIQVTATNLRTGFWDQASSWFMQDDPYQIAYRFSWLDAQGMTMDIGTQNWIPLSVIPGDTIRIQSISPNTLCKDFTLSIKENRSPRSSW